MTSRWKVFPFFFWSLCLDCSCFVHSLTHFCEDFVTTPVISTEQLIDKLLNITQNTTQNETFSFHCVWIVFFTYNRRQIRSSCTTESDKIKNIFVLPFTFGSWDFFSAWILITITTNNCQDFKQKKKRNTKTMLNYMRNFVTRYRLLFRLFQYLLFLFIYFYSRESRVPQKISTGTNEHEKSAREQFYFHFDLNSKASLPS